MTRQSPDSLNLAASRLENAHLLFVRYSALGDVVLHAYKTKTLKTMFPKMKLTWFVDKSYQPLLKDLPWVDEFLCWDRSSNSELNYLRLLCNVRHRHFDVLFNAQGVDRILPLALTCGAALKIGSHKHLSFVYDVDEWALLRTLGVPLTMDRSVSSSLVRPKGECRLSPFHGQTGIVLAIGGSHPRKRVPADTWINLYRLLRKQGLTPALIGNGPEEAETARQVEQQTGAVNLVGQLSIDDLARVIDDAELTISGDTGPLHIARGLGKRVIGLFGVTRLEQPYMDSLDAVIHTSCPGYGCFNWKCRRPCLELISPETIAETAVAILQKRRGSH